MAILHALEGVLILFLLGSVGYWLAWKKWFSVEATALIPKVLMTVALPPYLMYTLVHNFKSEDLAHVFHGCAVPFASMLLSWVIAYGLCKILKVSEARRGVLCAGFSTSNTVFIGIPVNLAVFGPDAMPFVLLYFVCNNIFFWTLGNYSIAHGGDGHDVALFSRGTVKQVLSPPFLGSLCGIFLVLFNIQLPHVILETCRYLGGLPTPLGLFFIGMMLYHMKFSSLRASRDLGIVIVGRFLVSPLIMVGLLLLFPVPKMMHDVFIIQSALPVMTNAAILAGLYRADAEFGTVTVMATTLLSMISVPLTVAALTLL